MHRFTKIVATIGPAVSRPETLRQLIAAGIDVVRLNFSHGKVEEYQTWLHYLRKAAQEEGRAIGVIADLQGPKIRVGKFAGSKIILKSGQDFFFDADLTLGDSTRVGLDYPELIQEVAPKDMLLLDDGRITMEVLAVAEEAIRCRVCNGGVLSNNKGINKQGGGLSAPALTDKDKADIKSASALQVDFVAVSFPKSGADMRLARSLVRDADSTAQMIAKIERVEAIANLEEIVEESDGVMVARGDLAVEVGDAAVPALQKRIIRVARNSNRFVITATQMMESMIYSPIPTRAEVSDVANAVLDGTDAVMLSAETASGEYPVQTVEAMARVCLEAERTMESSFDAHFLNRVFTRIDQSIAMAALFSAEHLQIKAIAAFTESGSTALWMSRFSVRVPIYALTGDIQTRDKCSILRGVTALMMRATGNDRDEHLREAERELLRIRAVAVGDLIAFTIGEPIGKPGGTNSLKLIRVAESGLQI